VVGSNDRFCSGCGASQPEPAADEDQPDSRVEAAADDPSSTTTSPPGSGWANDDFFPKSFVLALVVIPFLVAAFGAGLIAIAATTTGEVLGMFGGHRG
jgi:hypothetical protein